MNYSGAESSSNTVTRKALLDAAEELLPRFGVAGTSIRDIVEAAGANLGAVNYHFGSKANLMAEVILRRLRPVDEQRLARLDALEKAANGAPLKVEDILDALIRPVVESQDAEGKQITIFRLIDHAFQEADPAVKNLVKQEFAILEKRFTPAMLRALPHLPPEELFWRVIFFIGGLQYTMDEWSHFGDERACGTATIPKELNREEFIQRMIVMSAAALSVSVPSVSGKGEQ